MWKETRVTVVKSPWNAAPRHFCAPHPLDRRESCARNVRVRNASSGSYAYARSIDVCARWRAGERASGRTRILRNGSTVRHEEPNRATRSQSFVVRAIGSRRSAQLLIRVILPFHRLKIVATVVVQRLRSWYRRTSVSWTRNRKFFAEQ